MDIDSEDFENSQAKASKILEAARGLPLDERAAYVHAACQANDQLAELVRKRLETENGLDQTVDSSPPVEIDALEGTVSLQIANFIGDESRDDGAETVGSRSLESGNLRSDQDLKSGDQIGPFKVLKPLGQGGMGEVWMAEQSRPLKRRVALKVIKGGVGSREILRRFEAERQALAMMNHPNIARILDAGTTSDGKPYFAMELVPGKPITAYCDDNKLSVDERLELFVAVCDGTQHAHQKGIIHRDLKPGNVLVTVVDGRAVPKVIDFGLAKALVNTQKLTEQSLLTGIGQILGTLKYMSPEQASLDYVDIDTRTDIYALGVILYELLTETTPLEDSSIKGQAALKVLECIREQEPVRPSSRLGSSNDAQISSITSLRKTDSVQLNRVLAGDLDWIVLKALEIDRTRRYVSASGFAADVQRFLKNEPVFARPPSFGYLARKFILKNRLFVASSSLVLFTLLVGICGTTDGMLRAYQAESLARQRLDEAIEARRFAESETDAKEVALAEETRQRKYAESVTDYLTDDYLRIFVGEQEKKVFGKDQDHSILVDVLHRATKRLESTELPPEVEANRCLAIGAIYVKVRMFGASLPLLERAVALRSAALGPEHPQTIRSVNELNNCFNQLSGYSMYMKMSGNPEEALDLTEHLFTGLEKLDFSHPEAMRHVRAAISMHDTAGNFAVSDQWRATWIDFLESSIGADCDELDIELGTYGTSLVRREDWVNADPVVRKWLSYGEANRPGAWSTFYAMSLLGEIVFNRASLSNNSTEVSELLSEAKQLLLAGYQGLKSNETKIPSGSRSRQIRRAIERLIAFYVSVDNSSEVEKYQQLQREFQDR
ncbi:MAG: serine/threonine-protein kinase [Planctomycetota bacterium]